MNLKRSIDRILRTRTQAGWRFAGIGFLTLGLIPTLHTANADCGDTCNFLNTYFGESAQDNFGWVSSPVPDTNNDGADEVVITAPFNDAGGNNAGRVYFYSGKTGEELWRYTSTVAGENLGISVRDAGDVDGDLVADVIVGAPSAGTGRAYVLSGADGGLIHIIEGFEIGERFGGGVSGIGDVNNDTVDDLLVGAENHKSVFGVSAGRVYVISGADGSSVIDTIDAEEASIKFGNSMGDLGDIDNDDVHDFVVGAFRGNTDRKGKAFVYSGKTRSFQFPLSPTGTGAQNFSQFFVATAGDTNNDGTGDVYISDFSDNTNGGTAGKAYVFSGVDGSVLHEWLGQQGDGFSIGRACGDVNFDGHEDLLLCGWTYSGMAPAAGRAQVFSGKDGSIMCSFTSTKAGEGFGFDAHGIGDVNDDGRLDFFVTAGYNGEAGARAGKCYVISGGLTLQPLEPGVAGRINTTRVDGARPGNQVYLVGGTTVGAKGVPGCPGVVVGIKKPIIVGRENADANGSVGFDVNVPKSLRGRTALLQSVEPGDCLVSNLLEINFP